tara:strand:+ start:1265 stop:1456 length:192 start_codon:yes stop_codon:yes gene_type:complete
MPELSAYDIERLTHINHLMENINDSASEIYEHLVDREFLELKTSLSKLITQLKDIEDSIEDDI